MFVKFKDMSLKIKLLGLIIGSIFILSLTILLLLNNQITKDFSETSFEDLKHDYNFVLKLVEEQSIKLEQVAILTSQRKQIVESLYNGDLETLKRLTKEIAQTFNIEIMTITDPTGTVLVRTHTDKVGDNVSTLHLVKSAMNGKVTKGFDWSETAPLLLGAAAPLYYDNKLIGVVIPGKDFSKESVVDDLKSILGTEITIFKGDIRLQTTLVTESGSRAIGTKLTNNIVVESVLNKSEIFTTLCTLFGQNYYTIYGPLKKANDTFGILFLGKSAQFVESHKNQLMIIIGSVIAGILIFMTIISILIIRGITTPLKDIENTSQKFSEGNFDERLTIHSNDEIGKTAGYLNKAFTVVVDKMYWYENILNAIKFPISVTDNDMKWTFLNKAVSDLTKLDGAKMLGQQCSNWGADICNTDKCGIKCAEREKGQGRSYFTQSQFPGKEFLVDCSFIYDKYENKIGHVEVIQDITEANDLKRKAEQALKDGIIQAAVKLEGIVEVITSASEELSAQIEQSSRGAEEQSNRVSETATAMEEMNATVLEVAKNAGDAADVSGNAKSKAIEGSDLVNIVVQNMAVVQETTTVLKSNIAILGNKAEEIGGIMNVISDIADQTNLLALNAAIEAARAGDAGRGFTVVADEVRKLAEKTVKATNEVGNSIKSIQKSTKENIGNVDQVACKIDNTSVMATQSGQVLKDIVTLVEQASDQVRSIATASEEQSSASDEINKSIEQVATISSETSEAMNQSAKAVSELANQASILKSLIDDMKS